jgi:hypothetical protein
MIPLWMIVAGGAAAFTVGGVTGFAAGWWAGDTSQAIITMQETLKAAELRAAAARQEAEIAAVTIAEQTKQIAILEQTKATGALLAARIARDEREALDRARELEEQIDDVTARLEQAQAARGGCSCVFDDDDLRRLRSLERTVAPPGASRPASDGAARPGSTVAR